MTTITPVQQPTKTTISLADGAEVKGYAVLRAMSEIFNKKDWYGTQNFHPEEYYPTARIDKVSLQLRANRKSGIRVIDDYRTVLLTARPSDGVDQSTVLDAIDVFVQELTTLTKSNQLLVPEQLTRMICTVNIRPHSVGERVSVTTAVGSDGFLVCPKHGWLDDDDYREVPLDPFE